MRIMHNGEFQARGPKGMCWRLVRGTWHLTPDVIRAAFRPLGSGSARWPCRFVHEWPQAAR
jgi:hypothetical protein